MQKQTQKEINFDEVVLTLLKSEYQLGVEDYVDLMERLDLSHREQILESVRALHARGLVEFFAQENDGIFARVTQKGLSESGVKEEGQKDIHTHLQKWADFITNGKVIVSAVVILVAGFLGLLKYHPVLLQGSFLSSFVEAPAQTPEDKIKASVNMGELNIVPLGQADGKYLFQVEGEDGSKPAYFLFEMSQNEVGEWEITKVEKLRE